MGMRAEIYKGVTRALSRALRTPQYIILFVSDSCWMKCSHCWFNEDWKAQNLTGKRKKAGPLQAVDGDDRGDLIKTNAVDYERLSFDELERMAESIDMITFLTITGGEAFIRKDIVEITEMFAKKTRLFRYQIPTSGFVTDLIVTKTERMLQVNSTIPFRVDVSLDGTEETHDRIRNMAGSFQRVLTTVRELNKLKRKYAHFDVGIISTISKQNQHEVEAMSKIAAEVNPDGEWMVNITRGVPRDPTASEVDPMNYIAAHKLIASRIAAGRYGGHRGHPTAPWLSAKNATRRQMIYDTITGTRRGGGCSAGALAAVIYSNGTVRPCELLEHTIGNIRDFDYDLRALWNSPRGDEVRNWIQETECICTQECFLSMDVLIQPQWWPRLIQERLKLAGAGKNLGDRADVVDDSPAR
ncbi:MAG TPA: radical SAM protein [Gemmatimonadaceae bacterium]